MNIIRQVGAFYELFQRSHNQRKRCPQFVREIGEETIAFLIIFFVNFRFHLFETDVVLPKFLFGEIADNESDKSNSHHCIEEVSPPGLP